MSKLDAEIGQMIEAYTIECEKANVSRNMDEQGRRAKDIVAKHSRLDVLASAHWEGLYYEAKIIVLRDALLEWFNAANKPAKAAATAYVPLSETVEPDQVELEAEIEAAPAPKKPRKAKVPA
jgi:hypothetical protein